MARKMLLRVPSGVRADGNFGQVAITGFAPAVTIVSSGNLLFSETFPNPAPLTLAQSMAARGWYDMAAMDWVASPAPAGMPGAMRMNWTPGATTSSSVRARKLFAETDRFYLWYQIAASSSWVGSGQTFHPHLVHLMSNLDNAFSGLSDAHLTVYNEVNYQSGNRARVHFQDNQHVDNTHIGSVGTDEIRSTCGANGQRGYADNWDFFPDGNFSNGWWNARELFSTALMPPGDTTFHSMTVEVILNSIVGGVGQLDGVCRVWWDGRLIWNRTNLEMRTGNWPNLRLNQFIFAPFIGDGSPVNQTLYIGDVQLQRTPAVATNLSVTTQPAGAVDAIAFTTQPKIQLKDASARPVSQSGVTVTASIFSGAGSLVGTTTAVTSSGGEAVFTNLGVNATTPPSNFVLRFTAPGLVQTDSTSFSVSAGSGAIWPNEPAGSVTLFDYGWNVQGGTNPPFFFASGVGGVLTTQTDATAPLSPANVGRIQFTAGMTPGTGPCVLASDLLPPANWASWYHGTTFKLSPNYINEMTMPEMKMWDMLTPGGSLIWCIQNANSPFNMKFIHRSGGDTSTFGTIPILRDVWYQVELLVNDLGGGQARYRVWVNGVLDINTTGAKVTNAEFKHNWVMGGGSPGDSVTVTSFIYHDQTRFSYHL